MLKIAVLIFLPVMFTFFAFPSTQKPEFEDFHSIQSKSKLVKLSTFSNSHKGTFSPNGKLLALVGREYVDVVESASTRRLIHIAPDKATMLGAKFSFDSSSLAIAYKIIENSQTLRFRVSIWDVPSGRETLSLPVTTDEWYRVVDDLSFSKDSQLLASNLGGIARLWNLTDGSEYKRFPPPDNKPDIQSERVLLSLDGNSLAVYFKRQNPAFDVIRIWNLSNQKHIDLSANIYSDWAFSNDSKLLAITAIEKKGLAGEHSAVEIWDVIKGTLVKTIEVPKDWRGGFVVSFSHDATMLAIGGYKKFGLFSTQTGELLVEATHPKARLFQDNEMGNELSDIEFSPDGKLLLTGGNDGTVKLWRIEK